MITRADVQERIALTDRFYDALRAAMEQRHLRQRLVEIPGSLEPEWVGFERFTMRAITNGERRRRGLPELSEEHIAWVEHQACGHSDYARKYALYCSELAMGWEPFS